MNIGLSALTILAALFASGATPTVRFGQGATEVKCNICYGAYKVQRVSVMITASMYAGKLPVRKSLDINFKAKCAAAPGIFDTQTQFLAAACNDDLFHTCCCLLYAALGQ
eukprot:1157646-Pelagomonas_calceolata.AAC.21